MRRWTASIVGFALFVGLSVPRAADAGGNDLTGRPAPEIRLTDGLNGATAATTLASLRGKVVCLKFWLTHCPVCRGTLPEFQSIHETYGPNGSGGGRGVVCLGVVIDTAGGVGPYLREAGWTFPVGCDPDQGSSSRYGVRGFPGDYLIGFDGVVAASNGFPRYLVEREIERARPSVDEPKKNVEELGDVPAVLSAAKDAAAKNDYGAVLRLVEAHRDATKEPANVVAAAERIRELCKARWSRRVEKIRARWDGGDQRGAYADAVRFSDDFKDTTFHAPTVKWTKSLADLLDPAPAAK